MSDTLIKYGTTAVVSVVLAIGTMFAVGEPAKTDVVVVTATPAPATPLYTCPPGWAIPEGNTDEHGVVFSCVNGDWTVILRSDQTFSHGWNKNGGGFVVDPAGVPGWPD